MKIKGYGILRLGDSETKTEEYFDIEVPVEAFKFEFEVGKNGSHKAINFKNFDFTVDKAKIQLTHKGESKVIEDAGKAEKIKQTIVDELVRQVHMIKNETMAGGIHYLQKLPILNLTPLIALYHTTTTAERVQFSDDVIEYDISPATFKNVNGE